MMNSVHGILPRQAEYGETNVWLVAAMWGVSRRGDEESNMINVARGEKSV